MRLRLAVSYMFVCGCQSPLYVASAKYVLSLSLSSNSDEALLPCASFFDFFLSYYLFCFFFFRGCEKWKKKMEKKNVELLNDYVL